MIRLLTYLYVFYFKIDVYKNIKNIDERIDFVDFFFLMKFLPQNTIEISTSAAVPTHKLTF